MHTQINFVTSSVELVSSSLTRLVNPHAYLHVNSRPLLSDRFNGQFHHPQDVGAQLLMLLFLLYCGYSIPSLVLLMLLYCVVSYCVWYINMCIVMISYQLYLLITFH